MVDVVAEEAAAEAGGEDPGRREPDLAGADDAGGLAGECVAEQAVELEVAFAHAVVGFVRVAVQRLDEGDGEFGDGGGRVGGHARDEGLVFVWGLLVEVPEVAEVDVVVTGAAEEDRADGVGFREGCQDRRG